MPFSQRLNREHAFHDVTLTEFVERARHAVAIDERRALFPVVLWGDLRELNRAKNSSIDDPKAPYQEKWFPGNHGSVGGGGDVRGLSDGALAWVLKGAKEAGLVLDREYGTRIHGFYPDPFAALDNVRNPARDITKVALTDRDGPEHGWNISLPAIRRWHAPAEALPDGRRYRPTTLERAAEWLDAYPLEQISAGGAPILAEHTVQPGDTLSAIAVRYYGVGQGRRSKDIFDENRDALDEGDDLFPGQKLRIPDLGLVPPEPVTVA